MGRYGSEACRTSLSDNPQISQLDEQPKQDGRVGKHSDAGPGNLHRNVKRIEFEFRFYSSICASPSVFVTACNVAVNVGLGSLF